MKKTWRINKVIICIIAFISILIIGIILDCTNVLYPVSQHINYQFLELFVSNSVLIFIFFATYFLVDKRKMDKEEKLNKNKLNILNIMLKKTFATCKKVLEYFINDSYTLEHIIVSNISFKKNNGIDNVKNFQELPFSYDEQIMKMIYEGFVDKKIIKEYLEIKELYKSYIKAKIDFYDLLQHDAKELNDLKESIEEDNKRLTRLINEELKRIERILGE